jgi:hypothetical protein
MFVLKIPIVMLLTIVWWAVKAEPAAPEHDQDDGGSKRPHPRTPLPRLPRRGPHGDPALAPPPRTRAVVARARSLDG